MVLRAVFTLVVLAAAASDHLVDGELLCPTSIRPDAAAAETGPPPASGELTVVTYNVAGLPGMVSQSDPATNTALIAPRLGPFDVAVLQEDFCYHADLADAPHAHRSTPEFVPGCTTFAGPDQDTGDGLNRLAHHGFTDVERVDWEACSGHFTCGSDCMTRKGFTRSVHTLATGVSVDIYNLHMDSGECPEDVVARSKQWDQLMAWIDSHSRGRAVIIAGDTNVTASIAADESRYARVVADHGFRDACDEHTCGQRLWDRILVRDGHTVRLSVGSWSLPSGFVDSRGRPLSDHVPVAARIRWERAPALAGGGLSAAPR